MDKAKTGNGLPAVDRYPSRKEWEVALWRKIAKSKYLLELLTTPYERHNLVLRAAVRDRIRSGKSYRQIAQELWLSPQTISGIKKAVQRGRYQSYRERGKTERKKRQYDSFYHPKPIRLVGLRRRTKYGTIYIKNI